jgi:hypothetical protein
MKHLMEILHNTLWGMIFTMILIPAGILAMEAFDMSEKVLVIGWLVTAAIVGRLMKHLVERSNDV